MSPNRGHEIDAHGLHEGHRDKSEGECGVSEDSEERVVSQRPLALQSEKAERHQDTDGADGQHDIDREQETERHAEQRGVSERGAEKSHPPPDNETADRRGHQRHAEPGEQRA